VFAIDWQVTKDRDKAYVFAIVDLPIGANGAIRKLKDWMPVRLAKNRNKDQWRLDLCIDGNSLFDVII